ncbi:MAG: hypothetical protein GY939_24050 [Actinomycetia bacterium]|nr:hypothetical protein [Actinomycetes bacterium]
MDVHHRLPIRSALTTSFYAASQEPDDARRLFAAACADTGLGGQLPLPLPASRGWGAAPVLAREWGLSELEGRLASRPGAQLRVNSRGEWVSTRNILGASTTPSWPQPKQRARGRRGRRRAGSQQGPRSDCADGGGVAGHCPSSFLSGPPWSRAGLPPSARGE